MKDIRPVLRSLGLLDSEVNTYLAALEQGPQSVIDLAKRTHLSRQATYAAIEGLTSRGLMTSVQRDKKKFFAAEHPDKLLAYAKRRADEMKDFANDLERTLPELELQIGGERPTVRLFEGKEGIRAIITDMEKERPRNVEEITDLEAMYTLLEPKDLEPLRRLLARGKTHVQGIYAGAGKEKPGNVDRHFLPDAQRGFKSGITIYNDRIALIGFEGKMYSMIVESRAIANALRTLFTLAFEHVSRITKNT